MFPRVDERTEPMPGQTLALAAVSYVLSRCTHRPIGLFIIVDRQTTLVKVASVPVLAVHPEGAGPSWSPTHEYWRAVDELNLAGSGPAWSRTRSSAGRSSGSLDEGDTPVVGHPIALAIDESERFPFGRCPARLPAFVRYHPNHELGGWIPNGSLYRE